MFSGADDRFDDAFRTTGIVFVVVEKYYPFAGKVDTYRDTERSQNENPDLFQFQSGQFDDIGLYTASRNGFRGLKALGNTPENTFQRA